MMKFLVVAALASVALGGGDYKTTMQWQKLKAMESCWGEENMKLHTVAIKKAIAKCGNEDAPELSLPPFRSSYRFVNTMINKADEQESMQEMFQRLMSSMQNKKHGSSYRPYSQNYESMDSMKHESSDKMDMMKMMMKMMEMKKNMMEKMDSARPYSRPNNDNNNFDMMDMFSKMFENKKDNMDYSGVQSSKYRNMMDVFSRSKRDAGDNLDLGDRLVEKLADQRHHMEAKVGNMTCVLREMKCLDSNNEIDIRTMKADIKNYELPSEWFGEKYEDILDSCYEMATNLPADLQENSVITISSDNSKIKLGEIKMFMKCCSKAKTQLCMNQDIKKKVEKNFGPIEEILEETQLTEYEFFPLVVQLLHGKEMDYMTGDY